MIVARGMMVSFCFASSLGVHVLAADYPVRPIRYVVPFAAGSGPDVGVRLLAVEVGRRLGQQVVVDNRPGAAGSIGTEMVVRALPDGYTIGHGNIATLAINRAVLGKLPYDPDKDLVKVLQSSFLPNLMAVSVSLPVNSVQELIDYAKKNPGKLVYGAQNGTSPHLSNELFKLMTGTQIMHVPYKDTQLMVTDMIGNRLQLIIENMSAVIAHVKAGRIRGLAVTGPKRSAAIPELPTVAESGLKEFEVVAWSGVVLPARTDNSIVEKLNAVFNAALQSPELREKYTGLGYEIVGGTAKAFEEHVRKEYARWADVVKRANVKID